VTSELAVRPAAAATHGQPGAARGRARFLDLVDRHWLLIILLAAGIALRLITMLAYEPALLYIDSYRYLDNLYLLDPTQLDPVGYDWLLRVLLPLGGFRTVVLLQHLAGIWLAVVVYLCAVRHGARRWLAALATAPVLLDAYQLQIEQNIMSDVWLEVLLVAMLWLLVCRGAPGPWRAGFAGLLLALAVMTRTIALPVIVPVVLYLIVAGGAWRSKAGWRKIALRGGALVVVFGLALFSYAGFFYHRSGHWGLTGSTGNVLYGRTAEVADCAHLTLTPVLRELCPAQPLTNRAGVDYYSHIDGDPQWPGYVPPGESVQSLQHQFAYAVIEQQPLAVIGDIFHDFGKGFALGHTSAPTDVPVYRWQFQTTYPTWNGTEAAVQENLRYGGQAPAVNLKLATFLRDYQLGGGYTPGPLLALCGILGVVGGLGIRRRSGIRAATLLVTSTVVTVLFVSAMFEFSWRYQLPGLVLLPLAGVLGLTVLIGPLRRPKAGKARRKMLAPFPDPVDVEAVDSFVERYGKPSFAPVLVVIAAYNEEDGIGGVLDDLPSSCLDHEVDVLVVVDGCTDDTAAEAMKHDAYTCVAPRNRGQGAALRLGYQLAAFGGAKYVITTDADGQYDNSEMALLLGPLLADTHDFVTGSRRLGAAPTDDRVRWLGVRVFSALASVLTWQKISDTTFGFRGMRTELACSVPLRQPQYQASELLLGALAGGARLLEQPMTMRMRSAGTTKKGNNFVYGVRFSAVMTWTWMREYVGKRTLRLLGVRRPKAVVVLEEQGQQQTSN
jgi:hypothetical protein